MIRKRAGRYEVEVYEPARRRKTYIGRYPKLGAATEPGTARHAEAQAARRFARGRRRGPETVGSFAGRWARDYPRPKASTNRHNAERVKAFAKQHAQVALANVDRTAAREWALAHPSHLDALRAMFADAVRDGLLDANPFSKLRVPRSRGRRDLTVLTEPELHQLADLAPSALGDLGEQFRAMILFAAYVCLRPGELFALQRRDLHLAAGEVRVRQQVNRAGEITTPKNGRQRTVILPPAARDALLAVPARVDVPWVFTSRRGRQWRYGAHHYAWRDVRSAAGRPDMDWYELRHVGATMLLERGVAPADVAVQLGHTDGGALVMSTYGHPSEDAARDRLRAAYRAPAWPVSIDAGHGVSADGRKMGGT